jgi:hypothetical protein
MCIFLQVQRHHPPIWHILIVLLILSLLNLPCTNIIYSRFSTQSRTFSSMHITFSVYLTFLYLTLNKYQKYSFYATLLSFPFSCIFISYTCFQYHVSVDCQAPCFVFIKQSKINWKWEIYDPEKSQNFIQLNSITQKYCHRYTLLKKLKLTEFNYINKVSEPSYFHSAGLWI